MKKAAVAIDKYKLKVFKDAFRRAGFKWKKHLGVTSDTLILMVKYDDTTFDKLNKVVRAANEVTINQ